MCDPPRPNRSFARALGALAFFSLASCLGLSDPPDELATFTIVSGNNQNVTAGTTAQSPLVVLTLDQSAGPMEGVVVTWLITQGSGSLSAPSSTTDANGTTTVSYTAPATTGAASIKATAQNLSVTFNLTVVAGGAAARAGLAVR